MSHRWDCISNKQRYNWALIAQRIVQPSVMSRETPLMKSIINDGMPCRNDIDGNGIAVVGANHGVYGATDPALHIWFVSQ